MPNVLSPTFRGLFLNPLRGINIPELTDDPKNLKVLYNTVSPKIDIGSFDEFTAKMSTQENRQAFYKQVSPHIGLGDYGTFNEKVSSSYKKPTFTQELSRSLQITSKKIPAAIAGSFLERSVSDPIEVGEKLLNTAVTREGLFANLIVKKIAKDTGTFLSPSQKKTFIEAHPRFKKGREISERINKEIRENPLLQNPAGYREWDFGNMFASDKLGETIGSVLPSVLLSTGVGVGTAAITKSPIAGLVAATSVAYGMESGIAYDEAIREGLEPQEASKIANLVGVPNAIMEVLPVGAAIKKMGIGKQVSKSMAKRLIEKGAYKTIPKAATAQMVREGVTETLQELNSILVESGYKDGGLPSGINIGKRLVQAGFGGAIGGGGVGLVAGTVQQQKALQALPLIQEQKFDITKGLALVAPTVQSTQAFELPIEQGVQRQEEVPFVEEARKAKTITPEEQFNRINDVQTRIERELLKPNLQLQEDNPLIRKRTNTFIKEKVKFLKRGAKLSELDTRQHLTDLKMMIVQKARMDLPKSGVTTGQIKPLLTQIAKAKTIEDVEAAQERIENITENVQHKQAVQKIDKLLTKNQPKRIQGRLKGTILTPEIYKQLASIRTITKLVPEQIEQGVGQILEQDEITEQGHQLLEMYNTFGNLKDKTAEQTNQSLAELESIIKTGKSEKTKIRLDALNKRNNLKQMTLDVVTGQEGGKPMPEHEFIGSPLDKAGGVVKNYLLQQQSFEWLLDVASRLDEGSTPLQSRLNQRYGTMVYLARQDNNIILDQFHTKVHTFLKENFNIDGRKLGSLLNNNSKIVKKTGVFIGDTEIPMSKNQAYKRWMEMQDPTLDETNEQEGFTKKIMGQLETFMGQETLAWAEYQLNELYPAIYEKVNTVFKKLNGIDLPFNPFYSPIFREVSGDLSNIDDPLLRDTNINSTVMNSHFKSRTRSKKALKFRDGDAILQQYITQMSHYIAWGEPIHEMRQVLQSADVGRALQQYHSPRLKTEIDKHIDSLARGGMDKTLVHAGLDKIRGNFTKAVLGVNPVVFLKQLMSFPGYMMETPVSAFLKGSKDFWTNPIKKGKILMESPMMQARYKVGFERDVIVAMKKATPKALSETKNLSDTLLFFTKLGDRTAIMVGGWSVYKYHYDKSRKNGMPHNKARQVALTKFGMATTRAQQAGNIEDLGSIQRMGSFARLFTMFMTAPNQYFRSTYGAYRNLLAGRGTKSENLKRFAIAHWLLPMMFQFAASGFRWENKKQLRTFLIGSLSGLLIAGELIEALADAVISRESFGFDAVPITSAGEELIRGMIKTGKQLDEGFTTEETLKAIHDIARGTSKLRGIPYDPLFRISSGVVDLSKGELQDPRQLFGYTEHALGLKDKKKKKRF